MNTFEFVIRRVLRAVGIVNERNHLHVASQQTHYLSEAEDMLGKIAWKDVADVPELAEEYWKIKEIESQQASLQDDITGIEATNQRLNAERDELELESENSLAAITLKKTEAMRRAISQMHDVELSRGAAELTKKKYSGLRIKLKVLTDEATSEAEISAVQAQMNELKLDYARDKKKVEALAENIRATEAEVAQIEQEIESLRTDARARMAEMMNKVSRSSKLVADYTARIGSLEANKRALATKIGAFLAANYKSTDPDLAPILRKYRNILSKIDALRSSIGRRRLLAGRNPIDGS